ncbi:MAG: GNAT family N-acetyltransferase [Nocardioides sp.]
MTWTIEPLRPADCDELGAVHVQIWREAYAGLMPADYLSGLDPVARAERWQTWVDDPEDPTETWVARDDGGMVGFISTGPARGDHPPTPSELWAINLLARAQGTGLADALLARGLGDRDAYLWVLQGNGRAQSFYRRHGFADDGGRAVHEPTGAAELRMVRRT